MKLTRARHIDELRKLGFTGNYSKLQAYERMAHKLAVDYCNYPIATATYDSRMRRITYAVAMMFGRKLPNGFFINHDPRGHALKIVSEVNTLTAHDFGDYGILCPDLRHY